VEQQPEYRPLVAGKARAPGLPPGPLGAFELASAGYLYEAMTDYARSLKVLRACSGASGALDLANGEHRTALLTFLNAWGCRGLATDWHWLASAGLESWQRGAREWLAALGGPPWTPDETSRRRLSEVFDELSSSIAAHKVRKGRELSVSFGPTATSKTLFILRPDLFTAWDGAMRSACGYVGDGASYARFTADVHAKIAESATCSGGLPFLERLPEVLSRPPYTTLPQLVGEHYWITLTRGVELRSSEEIAEWLSW
jgi:hypothetical protein